MAYKLIRVTTPDRGTVDVQRFDTQEGWIRFQLRFRLVETDFDGWLSMRQDVPPMTFEEIDTSVYNELFEHLYGVPVRFDGSFEEILSSVFSEHATPLQNADAEDDAIDSLVEYITGLANGLPARGLITADDL
jgi:hypothetical protein